MVTLIFSDMHRKNPASTIEILAQEMPVEKLVFLGDYDSADLVKELLKLQISGAKKIIMVGNHDYPLVLESEKSGDARIPGYLAYEFGKKDYSKEAEKWRQDPLLRDFARKYLDNLRDSESKFKDDAFMHIEKSSRGKIVYCHASVYDSKKELFEKYGLSYQIWEPFLSEWKREDESIIRNNLLIMKEKNISIFFRGHDHLPRAHSVGKEENPLTAGIHFHGNPTLREDELLLEPERRYIVSVGAFIRDSYAIFDEKGFKVTLVDKSVRLGGI